MTEAEKEESRRKEAEAVEETEEEEEDRGRRFPVFFLLFLLLVIGGGIFGILRIRQYMTHRMEILEQSNPDPVAEALAAKLVSGDFQGLPVTIANGEEIRGETPFRELSRVAQFVRDKCSGRLTKVTAVAETEAERTYRIDAGAEPVLFLTLAEKKDALEYGYSSWEGKRVHIPAEELIPKTLYFRVPSGTVITLDGAVMDEAYRKEEEEHIPLLAQLTALELVSPPTFLSYEIEGIFLDPQVRMTDAEERELPYEEEAYRYTAGFTAPEGFAEEQEAWILSMIEPWGRYLTEDGGLGPAVARVRAGSPAYHTISKATVHWTAGHGGTSFADKSVDNFKVYSALCFSCDVHYKQTVHFREGRLWDTHMTWVFVRKDENAPWMLADVRMWYPEADGTEAEPETEDETGGD